MRRGIFVVAVLAAVLAAGHARASIDPARAESDMQALRNDGKDVFCKQPARPISARARLLCAEANDVPDCQGFVAACAEPAKDDLRKDPEVGAPRPVKKSDGHFELPAFLGTLARVLVWLLVAGVAIAILVPVIFALARLRRDKRVAEEPADAPGAAQAEAKEQLAAISDAELLLRKADERAGAGDLDAALQLYLGASLRALDQRGALRIAKDRTNGEYVRACKDSAAKGALREIVREVDRVQFGREAPSEGGLSRAKSRAVALVRALPLMLVALFVLPSCDTGEPRAAPWANPAGDDAMAALLERQGVPTKRLGQPIASLELPTPEHRGPVVVVDVERTALDDEARTHLIAWVEAGGVLVLAGDPQDWPYQLRAKSTGVATPDRVSVLTRMVPVLEDDPDEMGDYIARADARVVRPEALVWPSPAETVAVHVGGGTYAGLMRRGKGVVLGVANDELFTNVALARPTNAEAFVALLANVDPKEVRLASPEDGTSPPTDPVAAMSRAGLGLGMIHGFAAALVLFAAIGARLARPRPSEPPRRRAFTEHLDAAGALYARAKLSTHALASYARYAEERLHARMPRGTTDVPQFLASRTKTDLATCQRVWMRATNTKSGDPPRGDELALLRELSALFSAAVQ